MNVIYIYIYALATMSKHFWSHIIHWHTCRCGHMVGEDIPIYFFAKTCPNNSSFHCYTQQPASDSLNVAFYQNAKHMSLVNDIIQAKWTSSNSRPCHERINCTHLHLDLQNAKESCTATTKQTTANSRPTLSSDIFRKNSYKFGNRFTS